MNISKVFGFILALHLGVILVLIVQPGCKTNDVQPPSQSDYQLGTTESEGLSSIDSDLGSIYKSSQINEGLSGEDLSAFNDIDGFGISNDGLTVLVTNDSLDAYVIQSGDTLWDLAKKFDTTIQELCKLNNISKDSILRIGMKLNVPNVSDKTMNVDIETAATYQPSKYEGSGQIYKVSSGDSLSKIAYQFGVSVSAIKSTNGLSSDTILIGQELLLPVDETIKIKPSEPLKENIEEAVEIKPILTNSIVSEKVSDNSKDLVDSEDTSTLSSLSEEGELDMDQVPQVDYMRAPVQSE